MNKNIKNALLLGAVVAFSGNVMAAAAYDDSQFQDNAGTLTRKDSMSSFQRGNAKTQDELNQARDAWQAELERKQQQKDADIAHLQSDLSALPADEASIPDMKAVPEAGQPELHDLSKWGPKPTDKFNKKTRADAERENAEATAVFVDPHAEEIAAAKTHNEALISQWNNKKDAILSKIELLNQAKTKRDQMSKDADLIQVQTRREALEEKYKDNAEHLVLLKDHISNDEANHFSDEMADKFLSTIARLKSEKDKQITDLNEQLSNKDKQITDLNEQLDDAKDSYQGYMDTVDPLLEYIFNIPAVLKALNNQTFDTNSNMEKVLAAFQNANWDNATAKDPEGDDAEKTPPPAGTVDGSIPAITSLPSKSPSARTSRSSSISTKETRDNSALGTSSDKVTEEVDQKEGGTNSHTLSSSTSAQKNISGETTEFKDGDTRTVTDPGKPIKKTLKTQSSTDEKK